MLPVWYNELPRELIEDKAEEYGLDPLVIAAVIQHESVGVTWKTRSELRETVPRYDSKYLQYPRQHADRLGISEETERVAQLHSYGYMQIMGWLARSYGFRGYLTELCAKPDLNIDLGCTHLRSLCTRYFEESEVIAAYNYGHVARTPGGMFENQRYVDSVHHWLDELRKS